MVLIKPFVFITSVPLVIYISSQDPPIRPERCTGNAELLYRFCCVLPPFFTRDVAKECGAMFEMMFAYHEFNVTGMRRQTLTRCDYWVCILKKYGFLTSDEYVDHEKYFAHLDLWVSMNPVFTSVMVDAKLKCKQTYRFYFPLKPCEFFNMNMCIRSYITVECPVTVPTQECKEQKEFYKQCGKYFYN